ncbi:sodium:solute symporter family transporter [Echinicola shivajiensis]|uniref:sodium:solute symporter family transporter n=1 Tax=Echinicola shivajiensis TaxID=1035916 RepID=UPI001BFC3089|nr:sodium/solute symporter [Echinicola shivajiensis]
MKSSIHFLLLFIFSFLSGIAFAQGEKVENLGKFKFTALPDILPKAGEQVSPGFAGMFVGVHNDVLIMAGGANFPEKLPWNGGQKVYDNQIHVLEREEGNYKWREGISLKLPQNIAYGLSISTSKGVLCIGGENERGALDEAFLLQWDPILKQIKKEKMPDLPFPLSNAAGGIIDGKVYVAGGEGNGVSDAFLSLDLSAERPTWETLSSWPGEARSHAMGAVQHNGESDCFYLFGGRQRMSNGISERYHDTYCYNPKTEEWIILNPIQKNGEDVSLSAGVAQSLGNSHVIFYGGVRGDVFNQLERLGSEISSQSDDNIKDGLIKERNHILNNHPGFDGSILAYNTVTDSWSNYGSLPFETPVTTTAVKWGDELIIPSGEISPGIRTPKIYAAKFEKAVNFGWLNYTVLGIYLGSLVLMGVLISGKQHSTDDYFKAGGRVPWWAAGISIFGTQLSAITFMAIPAKTFATDWTLFFLLMTIIMVAPIIIYVFLPFFRRLNLTTAYEYLELRYNRTVRLIGSLLYTGLQLGRLGIVLLLPSLALSVVTGIDVSLCILIMGLLSIMYTVLGGIEAVIWTDVIQVIVLLGGALLCLAYIFIEIDFDFNQILTLVQESDKVRIFDMSFDFTGTSFWVVLIGGIASNIVQYGSDQTVIQRYLTTKDERTAARGISTGALMALPSAFIFFSIGTALYLFYKIHPIELSPSVESADSIFPFYIVTQLPQGLSGILIAAVFAAAMSSLDSSMNSVATVLTTDFYSILFPKDHKRKNSLRFARWVTVIVGLFGTGFALLMAGLGIPSLWDQFNMIIGLFAGGLGGIFLIGMLSKKVNGQGAVWGMLASAMVQVLIKYYSPLSIHLYAFTGLISAMVFTYIFSLLFSNKRDLKGLTVYSLSNDKTVSIKYEKEELINQKA